MKRSNGLFLFLFDSSKDTLGPNCSLASKSTIGNGCDNKNEEYLFTRSSLGQCGHKKKHLNPGGPKNNQPSFLLA